MLRQARVLAPNTVITHAPAPHVLYPPLLSPLVSPTGSALNQPYRLARWQGMLPISIILPGDLLTRPSSTYYYPSPSPASGAYPDYFPSGSSAACSPLSPSYLTPYGTSSSGYQVLTPSTSGSSLPTTPANGSPITGQKRRLRPSPSPPPMTAKWSDLCYTNASTVSPDNVSHIALHTMTAC
jgi:hypothetical protein